MTIQAPFHQTTQPMQNIEVIKDKEVEIIF